MRIKIVSALLSALIAFSAYHATANQTLEQSQETACIKMAPAGGLTVVATIIDSTNVLSNSPQITKAENNNTKDLSKDTEPVETTVLSLLPDKEPIIEESQEETTENIEQEVITEKVSEPAEEKQEELVSNDVVEDLVGSVIDSIESISNDNSFDTPLPDSLDDYLVDVCDEKGVDPALAAGVIEVESNFKNLGANSCNCVGYMQVNQTYADGNMYNGRENIYTGVSMLANYLDKYGSTEKALMAYNLGEGGAKSKWSQGIYSTSYSRKVISASKKY